MVGEQWICEGLSLVLLVLGSEMVSDQKSCRNLGVLTLVLNAGHGRRQVGLFDVRVFVNCNRTSGGSSPSS